jgi:hypothetical protein
MDAPASSAPNKCRERRGAESELAGVIQTPCNAFVGTCRSPRTIASHAWLDTLHYRRLTTTASSMSEHLLGVIASYEIQR